MQGVGSRVKGTRAQVMHGNAKQTGGGLKKKDLKYNKHGKIVSKKLSAIAKKQFIRQTGGASASVNSAQIGRNRSRGASFDDAVDELIINRFIIEERAKKITVEEKETLKVLLTQIINKVHQKLNINGLKDLTDSQIFSGIHDKIFSWINRRAIQKYGYGTLIAPLLESKAGWFRDGLLVVLLKDKEIKKICENDSSRMRGMPTTYQGLFNRINEREAAWERNMKS